MAASRLPLLRAAPALSLSELPCCVCRIFARRLRRIDGEHLEMLMPRVLSLMVALGAGPGMWVRNHADSPLNKNTDSQHRHPWQHTCISPSACRSRSQGHTLGQPRPPAFCHSGMHYEGGGTMPYCHLAACCTRAPTLATPRQTWCLYSRAAITAGAGCCRKGMLPRMRSTSMETLLSSSTCRIRYVCPGVLRASALMRSHTLRGAASRSPPQCQAGGKCSNAPASLLPQAHTPSAGPADARATATQMTMQVPDAVVPIILGKGGAIMREIQQRSGARIRVSQKGEYVPGTNDRLVTISAPSHHQAHGAYLMVAQKIGIA